MPFTPLEETETKKSKFTPVTTEAESVPVEAKTKFTPIETETEQTGTSLTEDLKAPFKRFMEIGLSEEAQGRALLMEGLRLPPGKVGSKLAKVGLGTLQWAFSPVTAGLRTFVGEPVEAAAEKIGLSPAISYYTGQAAEIGTALFGPLGIQKALTRNMAKKFPGTEKLLTQQPTAPPTKPTPTKRMKVTPEDVLKTPTTTKIAGTDIQKVLDKFDTADDISNVFANTTKIIESQVKTARRGKVTWEQAEEAARLMATSADDLVARKPGQAFNMEQLEAAKLVLRKATEEVHDAALKAVSGSDAELVQFQQYMTRYQAAVDTFLGARAEAGRALGILRKGFASTDDLKEVIEQLGGRGSLVEKAAFIAKAETPEQIAAGMKALRQAKPSDVGMEVWINMLLSGPQTHAVNVLSNTITALWRLPEQLTAATIGKFHKGQKVYGREVVSKAYGMMQGAKEGARSGIKTFLTEQPSDLFSKLELAHPAAISAKTLGITAKTGLKGKAGKGIDTIGKFVRVPGRALMAEDEFFKAIAYRGELNALAMRDGLQKGLGGKRLAQHVRDMVSNPSKAMQKQALDEARYVTFTKPLGKTGLAVQRLAASHPSAKLLMPFIRTPTNIIKFAGERTPLALFSQAVRAEIKKGGVARDMALAKMAWGTTVMSAVVSYAADGQITGGGPTDPAERAALYLTGWKPYSIKVGDEYYSYARLEPIGMLFGIAADYSEISGQMETKDAEALASMMVASASKNITSKTWLRGVSNALEAIENSDRYAADFIAGLAGTIVPTGAAQVARTMDPVLRDARTVMDRIRTRTPGYSHTVPARRNLWGETIVLGGGWGPDIISPIYTSRIVDDKVNDEIVRLKLKPAMPAQSINNVKLDQKEYWKYVEQAGQPAKRILDRIVNMPSWDLIPDYRKKELITDQIEYHRRNARKIMIAEDPHKFKITPRLERIEEIRKDIQK